MNAYEEQVRRRVEQEVQAQVADYEHRLRSEEMLLTAC